MPDLASELRQYVDSASTITLDEVSSAQRSRPRRRRTLVVVVACCCIGATAIAVVVARSTGRRHVAPTVSVTPTSMTPSSVPSPPPLSAHVELPSTTLVAGSSETAYLVIENNTGKPIPGGGCGPELALALGNDHVHPLIVSRLPSCACPSVECPIPNIPVGQSQWPVTLRADNESPCSLPGEPSDPPTRTCGLNGDPLPPGDYHTEFFGTPELHPYPVTVHVVASDNLAATTTTTGQG